MSIRTSQGVFVCAAALCLAPHTLTAQSEPLTHVGIFKLKPGAESLWKEIGAKYFAPMMSRLMQDGTVLAYGVETDVHHVPGEANADIWYVVPNAAAYQKAIEETEKMQSANASSFQKLLAGMDIDKHQDLLLRPITRNGKAVPAGTMPYTEVSITKLKPGMGEQYKKLFDAYVKPVYDRLVDDGTIIGYGLYQEAFHSSNPGMRWTVVTAPSLAAWDKIEAAFNEDRKRRTPQEIESIRKQYMDMADPEAHRDYLSKASIFATK